MHSKDNSITSIKKPLSVTRNRNLNNKIPPNTILNYNYNNFKKRKRNISINPEFMNNTVFMRNKIKMSIDFSERGFINKSLIKNKEISIENGDKLNNGKLNKTQRAKEYSIKVKKFNLAKSIISNERNLIKNPSDIKKENNDKKFKLKNRANSSIYSSNMNKCYSNISQINNKKNSNKEVYIINGGNINENNYMKNKKKSRNERKVSAISCKNSSIEINKKNNGLTSSTMSINMNTMYNRKKNQLNKDKNNSVIYKNLNQNDKKNIISNYAQIYLKKNYFENGMVKNQILYNKSLTGLKKVKK